MEKMGRERRTFAKTKRAHFLYKLETEFDLAPRLAQAVLAEAEACLCEEDEQQATGKRWVLLATREAGHGQRLSETATCRVCWTIDAGEEDHELYASQGRNGLRRVRIQRLLDEAVEQGA